MTIPETIKKAIEGGLWEKPRNVERIVEMNVRRYGKNTAFDMWFAYSLLHPSFWQSLGKALGWENRCRVCGRDEGLCNKKIYNELKNKPNKRVICPSDLIPGWIYHWHRFIDFLAIGGTIEKFFETL